MILDWLLRLFRKPKSRRPYPGPWSVEGNPSDLGGYAKALIERNRKIEAWNRREDARLERESKRC